MRADESSALLFTRALARGRGLHILGDAIRRSLSLPSFSSFFCLPLENVSIHLSAYYQIILCMNIGIKFVEIIEIPLLFLSHEKKCQFISQHIKYFVHKYTKKRKKCEKKNFYFY